MGRADRKEVGDMVAEGAIVGMLLQGHDLDGVVPQLPNSGQHGHSEIQVAIHPRLLAGHPNVGLIDAQRPGPAQLPTKKHFWWVFWCFSGDFWVISLHHYFMVT